MGQKQTHRSQDFQAVKAGDASRLLLIVLSSVAVATAGFVSQDMTSAQSENSVGIQEISSLSGQSSWGQSSWGGLAEIAEREGLSYSQLFNDSRTGQ